MDVTHPAVIIPIDSITAKIPGCIIRLTVGCFSYCNTFELLHLSLWLLLSDFIAFEVPFFAISLLLLFEDFVVVDSDVDRDDSMVFFV